MSICSMFEMHQNQKELKLVKIITMFSHLSKTVLIIIDRLRQMNDIIYTYIMGLQN